MIAALLGIATVVLLITLAKLHPFLALMLGAAVMGGVAAVAPLDIVTSFTNGFGTTVGSVGILIALGAMVGKLLADSGGSDTIVDTIIGKVGARGLPWAMARSRPSSACRCSSRSASCCSSRSCCSSPAARHPRDAGGHPGAGRSVDPARPGAAAPGPAGRHRRR